MGAELDDVRRRLEAVSEELAELAVERLREAIDAGAQGPPIEERRLQRARRAVEKAIAVLGEGNGD